MAGDCYLLDELPAAAPDDGRWRNPATGLVTRWPWQHPHGALWWSPFNADGLPDLPPHWRKDRALWVYLPGGPFCIDGPSYHWDGAAGHMVYGEGWTRSGEPPRITVSPSIVIGDEWHGHIRDGHFDP